MAKRSKGVVLAVVGVLAAVYELVAVKTGVVPTITKLVKATPFWIRVVLLTALPVYLWVDHIFWDGGLV